MIIEISKPEKLTASGIIAGRGNLPLVILKAAVSRGLTPVIFGIATEVSPELEQQASQLNCPFYKINPGELQKILSLLNQLKIKQLIMAGKIEKSKTLFFDTSIDQQASDLLKDLQAMNDDAILGRIVAELNKLGIEVLSSISLIQDLLPPPGIIAPRTSKQIPKPILDDIRFGYQMAKGIAALDIGQTVAVKSRAVLAVEAIEGTDLTIERAGKLGNGGITIVKVAKPRQDLRFDMPVIGMDTLKCLKSARATALAVEAGMTIVLDLEKIIEFAETENIFLYSIDPGEF